MKIKFLALAALLAACFGMCSSAMAQQPDPGMPDCRGGWAFGPKKATLYMQSVMASVSQASWQLGTEAHKFDTGYTFTPACLYATNLSSFVDENPFPTIGNPDVNYSAAPETGQYEYFSLNLQLSAKVTINPETGSYGNLTPAGYCGVGTDGQVGHYSQDFFWVPGCGRNAIWDSVLQQWVAPAILPDQTANCEIDLRSSMWQISTVMTTTGYNNESVGSASLWSSANGDQVNFNNTSVDLLERYFDDVTKLNDDLTNYTRPVICSVGDTIGHYGSIWMAIAQVKNLYYTTEVRPGPQPQIRPDWFTRLRHFQSPWFEGNDQHPTLDSGQKVNITQTATFTQRGWEPIGQ